MTASIRDQLRPDQRAAWDRIWARLLGPVPDDPVDDPQPDEEEPTADAAA